MNGLHGWSTNDNANYLETRFLSNFASNLVRKMNLKDKLKENSNNRNNNKNNKNNKLRKMDQEKRVEQLVERWKEELKGYDHIYLGLETIIEIRFVYFFSSVKMADREQREERERLEREEREERERREREAEEEKAAALIRMAQIMREYQLMIDQGFKDLSDKYK